MTYIKTFVFSNIKSNETKKTEPLISAAPIRKKWYYDR